MKRGRNHICYCGSQKKYKNCCLKIDNKPSSIDIINEVRSLFKNSKFKECFHPQKEECGKKIIKAHAIQNNKILNKLSVDGKVIMTHYRPDRLFEFAHLYGRKQATTFTGFCDYHDQEIFKDIEIKEFKSEEKQLFLYAYRAFVSEYYKKITDLSFSGNFSNEVDYFKSLEKGQQMAVSDFLEKKFEFNNAIKNKRYDCLINVVWEFDREVNFAACGYYAPETDLNKNIIQDLIKDKVLSHIYYNVFPDKDKSIVLLSWLKSDGERLFDFKRQFSELNRREMEYYVSNVVINNTDNLVINPTAWEKLSESQKEIFGMHELFMLLEYENERESMIKEPEVNLFNL